MKKLMEGIRIPLTETHIALSGHDDKDNPICDAIVEYLENQNYGERFSVYFCFIDEKISIFGKGTSKRFGNLFTTTLLEDWLRAYFDHREVQPFTLKIFHQRDPDTNEIEDDRLWIGITEDGDGFSESSLEKLYGKLSYADMIKSRQNAFAAGQTGVNCDDICPVQNVLRRITSHLPIEITSNNFKSTFYQDDPQVEIVLCHTPELTHWLERFYNADDCVKECVIYINRDDTLPDQPLFVGIDFNLAPYNLTDFQKIVGMEGRVTRKHIDESKRGDCEHCAVATVLSEMFPHYEVNVNGEEATIHTRGTVHVALLISESLGKWIDAYDQENDVGTLTLVIKNLAGDEYYKYLLDIKELTERQKDLQERMSSLSQLSSEMELHIQKLSDSPPEECDKLMQKYDDLFAETVYEFGN